MTASAAPKHDSKPRPNTLYRFLTEGILLSVFLNNSISYIVFSVGAPVPVTHWRGGQVLEQ